MMILSEENGKKDLKKKRMITYFVNAADEVMRREGIDKITVRKVTDAAGYNCATLYNYFRNLKHLVFYTSLRYLKPYAGDLSEAIKSSRNPLEQYFNVWKIFSKYSYENPEIFYLIFFSGFPKDMVNDSIKSYYQVFSEDLNDDLKELYPMLTEGDIMQRDYILLRQITEKGDACGLTDEELRQINEINVLIYQSMLIRFRDKTTEYTTEEAVERTLCYLKRTLLGYGIAVENPD